MVSLKWSIGGLLALFALLVIVVVALCPEAAAQYEEYTDNENSGSAKWIEPPHTMGPVHLWRLSGSTNTDWWKFNATGGDHVEVRFRKYTRYPDVPGLPGYTYYIKWDLWGPYVPGRNVYRYESTYPGQGQPREHHRRDTLSYMVPETLGGIYFLRIYVDPPNNDPYREWAFYWMNVTVTTPPSLDTQRSYQGEMGMHGESNLPTTYDIDFNFDDYYTITLGANATRGDLVTVTMTKAHTDHRVWVEAYERIPFGHGGGQNDHMVNRSYYGTVAQLRIQFTADHPGTYWIRVYRYFYDTGDTTYSLDVFVGNRALEGDDQAENGTEVLKASTVRYQDIEMGFDTHDWYKCQIVAGDRKFGVTVDLLHPSIDDGYACELVVYNGEGLVMWAVSNRVRSGNDYVFRTQMSLPPPGTPTIFDEDEWYYVRVSVDSAITSSGISGFNMMYNVAFELSNRAPELVVPFEEVYTWDEDGGVSIELDSHFFDVDGDEMEYTIFNKTPGTPTFDTVALEHDGYLNITSPADWHGEVWWRLMAIDEGQTSDLHKIFVELHLVVSPVPDRPRVVDPGFLNAVCDEEGNVSQDLNDLFYDVDEGPGGVLTFGLNETGQAQVAVDLDSATGIITFEPEADVFGQFDFDVFCYDDVMEPVYGAVRLTVRPVNDVPRITAVIPPVEMDEGDDVVERDLGGYFHDVDGDELLYTWKVPSEYSADLNVYHKNNVVTESRIVIELTDEYWYGYVVLNITCTDEADTFIKQDLVIDVSNVPNPPIISYTPADDPSDIEESQDLTFRVTDVVDPDAPEFGQHNFTWYLDGGMAFQETGTQSTFIYISDYDSEGTHTVRVVVTDPAGLSPDEEPTWTFVVLNKNRDPTVEITNPPTSLREDQRASFTVAAQDPDGEELTISWYLVGKTKDKLLGTGAQITARLPPGRQTVEVEVEDPHGVVVKDSYTITVKPVEEESSMGLVIAIVVIVIIVAAAGVAVGVMRGKKATALPPEAQMDLDSVEREYEGYDPKPKEYEGYEELRK